MLPYYLLIFAPVLPLFVRIKSNKEYYPNQSSMKLFFILLFFMLALRSIDVGRDLDNYRHIFNSFSEDSWAKIFSNTEEMSFAILNKLISVFTSNFQWVMIICAVITIIPIGYIYIHENENSMLTISLFITMSTFIMLFSGIRQSIAIALGMIAYQMTKKKKLIPFLLISLLAFTFHRSAFMLIIMYPVYHAKIDKKKLLLVIPILGAVIVFNKQIFAFLASWISDWYTTTVSNTGAYTMLILFAAFLVFSFLIPDDSLLDKEIIGLRNFLILSLFIQMFAPLNYLAMRMNYYYIIFIPLLIPKIVNRSSSRWKRVAVVSQYIMIIFFLSYFFISAPRTNSLDTFPYHFFWEASA